MEGTTDNEALVEDGGIVGVPPTKKVRWVDDLERRRAYHNAYYQKRKAARPPAEKKKGVCDWTNPEEVRALKKKYAEKKFICTACKKSVRACSTTHHRRSKTHLQAVARWLADTALAAETQENVFSKNFI